ncbi:hypothetical protein B7P43_G05942 [Cryptotermes secundus]|uniref:Uncharacterized protein n=1 Tax=Cryptotermes secundus TaxID=105785 RepID=A0A2J7PUL2_9NEOP|nr:hypothetical protein B7P43_G05942 [Cryptotermes secundus]
MEFCDSMLEMMEDETFISLLIFSDEATFYLSGRVNRHNVRIWGTEHPHETVEHETDSPKMNVFCAVSQDKVYEENTVTGQTYLDMLQDWLFTSLQADSHDFILQQDGVPPLWHLIVRQVMKFLIMQFSPNSCHFISLWSKFLNTLFSNTLRLCSSLNIRDKVSHTYRTADKIIVLYILIFNFLDSRREDKRFWTEW